MDETHTKRHIVVRVTEKVEEKKRSTEERLQFLEDELTKVRQDLAEVKQTLGNLQIGKSAELSQSESPMKGGVCGPAIEVGSTDSGGEFGTKEIA